MSKGILFQLSEVRRHDHWHPEGLPGLSLTQQAVDLRDIELELRFRELKGPFVMPHMTLAGENYGASASIHPPKTEAQQSDDLMKQMRDEAALERRAHNKDEGFRSQLDDIRSPE